VYHFVAKNDFSEWTQRLQNQIWLKKAIIKLASVTKRQNYSQATTHSSHFGLLATKSQIPFNPKYPLF